ncbi:hypothetical protein ACFV1L_10545 [Kitasatospora sp. NPDC059646]|uniref:hypothetical protein n=1 Tax=Kitasatospora sp. NPDC059646 TaxID=3346893 RepID=UPI0036C09DF2
MIKPTGTCPTCGRLRVPLTPTGRVQAHYTPGARGTKCKGGRPATTPEDQR